MAVFGLWSVGRCRGAAERSWAMRAKNRARFYFQGAKAGLLALLGYSHRKQKLTNEIVATFATEVKWWTNQKWRSESLVSTEAETSVWIPAQNGVVFILWVPDVDRYVTVYGQEKSLTYNSEGCLWHSHGKNPVQLYPKLQSQPIGLRKIYIDCLFFQADQSDCTKSVSIFNRFASSEERWKNLSPLSFPTRGLGWLVNQRNPSEYWQVTKGDLSQIISSLHDSFLFRSSFFIRF